MVVMNRLISALVIIIVLVLLLAMFYSEEGLFSKIKEKVLGVGDDVPGVDLPDDSGDGGDEDASES